MKAYQNLQLSQWLVQLSTLVALRSAVVSLFFLPSRAGLGLGWSRVGPVTVKESFCTPPTNRRVGLDKELANHSLSQLPIFISKVLLDHSHVCSLMYCPWLLSLQGQSWIVETRVRGLQSWEWLLLGPSQKSSLIPELGALQDFQSCLQWLLNLWQFFYGKSSRSK